MPTNRVYRIAVIPGDGIGKEVVPEGVRVLEAAAKKFGFELRQDDFDFASYDYYAKHQRMMPEDWKEKIGQHDAIFFGAVGWPDVVPDHISLWGSLLQFRRAFDQYVSLRPVRLMPGVPSPLAGREPGDVDFYDLGAPPAGSKIFAAIDAAAANQSDFEMRITTGTDTIGYDHDDGTSWVGSNAPIVAGPIAPGGEIYARIDSVPAVTGNEPYSFFARIETGAAQAEDLLDITPSGPPDFNTAITVTGGGFVKGTMSTANDMDCFEFVAYEGDDIVAFSDNNPDRAAGTITNVWPELVTLDGAPPSNTLLGGQVLRNIDPNTPSSGLAGVTPSVTSEFQHYRARYTGAYMICYTPTSDINNATNPPASDYPLPYAGSISLTCSARPGTGPSTRTAMRRNADCSSGTRCRISSNVPETSRLVMTMSWKASIPTHSTPTLATRSRSLAPNARDQWRAVKAPAPATVFRK
jgi:hypothetical protein